MHTYMYRYSLLRVLSYIERLYRDKLNSLICIYHRMSVDVERAVREVFRLFEKYGEGDYLGEAVSKTNHSIQCATLAEREGQPIEV